MDTGNVSAIISAAAGISGVLLGNSFVTVKLAAVAGSIRFHKVLAIETKAKEYARVSDLFMDDDVRKQLGLLFT